MKPSSIHLLKAHTEWSQVVKPGDIAIDATCGNGHDTLVIAKMILTPTSGALYAFDIQAEAILKTKQKLLQHLPPEILNRIHLIHSCHTTIGDHLLPESVKLIVYNLGYLPGSNKTIITQTPDTLTSLEKALSLLTKDGLISITCYPGHLGGKEESEEILNFIDKLDSAKWSKTAYPGLKTQNPILIFIKKKGEWSPTRLTSA